MPGRTVILQLLVGLGGRAIERKWLGLLLVVACSLPVVAALGLRAACLTRIRLVCVVSISCGGHTS